MKQTVQMHFMSQTPSFNCIFKGKKISSSQNTEFITPEQWIGFLKGKHDICICTQHLEKNLKVQYTYMQILPHSYIALVFNIGPFHCVHTSVPHNTKLYTICYLTIVLCSYGDSE